MNKKRRRISRTTSNFNYAAHGNARLTNDVVKLLHFSFVPLWINSQPKIDSWRMSCRTWHPRRSRWHTGKLRLQRSFSGTCRAGHEKPLPFALCCLLKSHGCLPESLVWAAILSVVTTVDEGGETLPAYSGLELSCLYSSF
jgi:hypothetical protein